MSREGLCNICGAHRTFCGPYPRASWAAKVSAEAYPHELLKSILVKKLGRPLSGHCLFRTIRAKLPDNCGITRERMLRHTLGLDVCISRAREFAQCMHIAVHGTYHLQSADPKGKPDNSSNTGNFADDAGQDSWLSAVSESQAHLVDSTVGAYTFSLSWALSNLTAAPTEAAISPQNPIRPIERVFKIIVILCSLLILGPATAKIPLTMQELYKLELAYAEIELELRRYSRATGTPLNLSSDIPRFAEEACKMKYALAPKTIIMGLLFIFCHRSLFSLYVASIVWNTHFFHWYLCGFKDSFPEIIKTFEGAVHGAGELVFLGKYVPDRLYTYIYSNSWIICFTAARWNQFHP